MNEAGPKNEAETRAELIDVQLKESGWGVDPKSKIRREYQITDGKIQSGGKRGKILKADYVLVYRGRNIAVIEAKKFELEVGEGVAQAKEYAEKLQVKTAFATNGRQIYQICNQTNTEGLIDKFPTPEELWAKTFTQPNIWQDKFNQIAWEDFGGTKSLRYYQEIAINRVLDAIAQDQQRILLTLATGTGKTIVAFQIAWKLFQSRWNLRKDGKQRPRILFLADRNILANQAFSEFNPFPDDALIRIDPNSIKKRGQVPTNGSIFFTIFQTLSNQDKQYFQQYDPDFFDIVIIDECHRGGANDESKWRDILEYFSPAVQLGLTATPKRDYNVNTYEYFGNPVYSYSLKEGINNGFLTPFRIKQIITNLDEYIYDPDDDIIEGEIDPDKIYTEADFNKNIQIIERERERVKIFLADIRRDEKTIVFCANQPHAALIRDLINQEKAGCHPQYCVRVTADDGDLGEQYLKTFQDNDKNIPCILTTSSKLSTGVNARNIRNIVLLRPIKQMIEFKQIIGRGTRLFEGKDYFTIYDFVGAYQHFSDPAWDGDAMVVEVLEQKTINGNTDQPKKSKEKVTEKPDSYSVSNNDQPEKKIQIKIGLRSEFVSEYAINTLFPNADGKMIKFEEYVQNLYGFLPPLFDNNEAKLREIWSHPTTRQELLEQLEAAGFNRDDLERLKKMIQAEKSDLFDVLELIAFSRQPLTRQTRVTQAENKIYALLNQEQKEFLEFVLSQYIEIGDQELNLDKLQSLIELKYHTISDAQVVLGDIASIQNTFINFQKYLYDQVA
jgi:type I restriction enzyme R subunit